MLTYELGILLKYLPVVVWILIYLTTKKMSYNRKYFICKPFFLRSIVHIFDEAHHLKIQNVEVMDPIAKKNITFPEIFVEKTFLVFF